MVEYGVYDANYDAIEKENVGMAFPTTKSINVFRFIREIRGIVTLPIQEFERSSDIKGFISKQWADMFKNYLNLLRERKENKKIENSVNEMKYLIQKMDIMLDSVGKSVLSKESPSEYTSVVNQQEIILFCNSVVNTFRMFVADSKTLSGEKRKKSTIEFLNSVKAAHEKALSPSFVNDTELNIKGINCVWSLFKENLLTVRTFNPSSYEELYNKIPLLENEENMEKIVETLVSDNYFNKLVDM